MDIQSTQASATPPVIRREDYRPPDWLVPEISLAFDLGAAETRVVARLTLTRNGAHDRAIRLDGDSYFLMGDNRPSSLDSRSFGSVHAEQIIGRVVMRYWPLNQIDIYP